MYRYIDIAVKVKIKTGQKTKNQHYMPILKIF